MGDIFDFRECTLCPRECKANRERGKTGVCGASNKIFTARASLHLWEEPCLSGANGSGTVFFTGCSLSCVYCQNSQISHKNTGYEIDENRLCEIFFELRSKGAHNINLVTAAHFLPNVLKAVEKAKVQGIGIPFVYNSSGYEKAEALTRADGLIDIYLPDFKYFEEERAKKYSFAPDYPQVAKALIAEMVRQQPKCVFDENGMMLKGVIVRHLMLPSGFYDSKKIVKYLHKTYGSKIYMSLMSQYTPFGNLENYPELQQKINAADYEKLIDCAINLGVENAFIQDGESSSESFIPDFSGQGIINEVK